MPEAKAQVAFDQAGLGSVLKQFTLAVPPNQRDYAWTDEEVIQLFQDFARAIREDESYFLGTIVTIPRANELLEVVDGQQRLATTAILLSAIREYLAERGETVLVESIDNEFLTGIDRNRRERVPKLTLNVDDNDLFGQIVRGLPVDMAPESPRPSHELLLDALRIARAHVRAIVAGLDVKDHGDLLNAWVSFIEHQALVVLLRVPDDADAYRMFETLNDRGLRTSQVDLIKNYLFGRAGSRLPEVQNRWSYMRGTLESLDEEHITINFLRHALIVQKGYLREAEVYEEVQRTARAEQSTVTLASTLESLATIYAATFNSDHERWNAYPDQARHAIEVFNWFGIKPMRPLVVSISSKMDINEATRALTFLVALGVRLMIASSTRSGSVEQPLANAARDVFAESTTTAAELAGALSHLTPSDQEFRVAFEQARVSNAKLAKYYLRSLEMTAKAEPEPWFTPQDDQQVINLEHVLPRKPGDNWPTFTEDDVRLFATRLGNLTLLRKSDNSALHSDSFTDKRAVYGQCPYLLTSQIAELAEWTPDTITARQITLADLAVTTWPAWS